MGPVLVNSIASPPPRCSAFVRGSHAFLGAVDLDPDWRTLVVITRLDPECEERPREQKEIADPSKESGALDEISPTRHGTP
jgi:hypothetical protein